MAKDVLQKILVLTHIGFWVDLVGPEEAPELYVKVAEMHQNSYPPSSAPKVTHQTAEKSGRIPEDTPKFPEDTPRVRKIRPGSGRHVQNFILGCGQGIKID